MFAAGQQFSAGSVNKAAGSRRCLVKIVERSSYDCKTTEDNE